MSDPISGGIGKASQQMMQELQKQMQETAQTGGADKASFKDAVANVQNTQGVQETQKVTEAQKTMETQKSTDVIKAAANKPGGVAGVDGAASKVAVEKSEAGKGFQKLLGSLVEDQNKLDEIIKAATSGKKYDQQELLAIQASVYKFSQELELTSKVVEKATSGVKQTMQTQV